MTAVIKVEAQVGAGKAVKVDVVGAPGEPHTTELLTDGQSAQFTLYANRRVVFTEAEAPEGEAKAENAAPSGDPAQPE